MIQNNLAKILLVLLAAGALLTGYNAFVNSNNDTETNASTKLANYLSIDRARQAAVGAEDVVAGTDSQPSETPAAVETTPTEVQSTTVEPETAAPAAEEPAPESTTPTPTSTDASPPATSVAGDRAETRYTVKEGDTYGCIAEKYYGSLEQYTDIMAANPVFSTGFGEYSLHVGAQLVLPAVLNANLKPASTICQ